MIVNITKTGNTTANASLTGWTLIAGAQQSTGPRRSTILYKVATGSEPTSYTFALGTGNTSGVGSIIAFSGVDASVFDVTPGSLNTDVGTTVTATGITSLTNNAVIVFLAGAGGTDADVYSNWSGSTPVFTEIMDFSYSSVTNSVGAAWGILATAGATGDKTVTVDGKYYNAGILIALKPVPGPGSSVTTIFSYTGSTQTFVVPNCVTSITVEAWGGGGAGYNGSNQGGGKGGGGGGYAKGTIANPAGSYQVVVGKGGSASSGIGADGAASVFGSNLVVADYGRGGTSATTGGGAGGTNNTGNVTTSNGGTGGNGNGSNDVGGGGGGAGGKDGAGINGGNTTNQSSIGGNGGAGDNGSGGAGGAGGNGADGGNGVDNSLGGGGGGGGDNGTNGGAGGLPGGGGGGGENAGGAGANGQIIVSYTLPNDPTITLGGNPSVCYGSTSANLSYSATTGCPDKYSIVFDAAAHTAGFVDVTDQTLGSSPIVIAVPSTVSANTYSGTLTVKNSTYNFGSSGYSISVTVRPQFTAGAINATGQTICYNTVPTTQIGSTTAASGGDNSIMYQWQYSTDNTFTTGVTTVASNTASYTPTQTLTQTTYYRRQAHDGTCNTTFTSSTGVWQVTVNPNANINLTSAPGTDDQTVCINSSITDITYSISGGGTGAGVTGLPSGVTGAFSAGVFTISGAPTTATGSPFNYDVTTTGTCTQTTAHGTITVNLVPDPAGSITGPNYVAQGNPSVTYNVGTITNATSYVWSYTGSGVTGLGTTASVNLAFSAGATSGDLSVAGVNGICTGSSSTIHITVVPPGGSCSSTTWNGNTDNDWFGLGNWSDCVPGPGTDVTIPVTTHNPIITGAAAECNTLTINTGAVLTINATASLTASGEITNNAGTDGLIIKSTASGTGNLIHPNTGVNARMELYIPSADWSQWDNGWHQISSPVAAQPINTAGGFVTSGANNGYDFYAWNEPTNEWVNFQNTTISPTFYEVNGSNNFAVGVGYMVAYQLASSKQFTGEINVSDKTFTNLSVTADYSWHLMGNPFASALTWGPGWTRTHINSTCAIWNATAKSYNYILDDKNIPAGSGFMVWAEPGNVLTIPASARAVSSDHILKQSGDPEIRLLAKNNSSNPSAQESLVLLNPASTNGFEFMYDAGFLPGYAPYFYSVVDNHNLGVNSIPEITPETVIPYSFIKNEGDNFSIEAQISNLPSTTTVWLLDKKTGTDQNLTDNPVYTFTSAAGDAADRFELHFFAAQWTGATNSSWIENGNWNGGVPLSTTNITINPSAHNPVIATPTDDVYALTVNAGASVTVDNGGELTITNKLVNNAGASALVVKPGGSLITKGTVSGEATIESSIAGGEWHFISSPVDGAQSGMFVGKYLQQLDEGTKLYTDITSLTEPLTPGKGFALFNDADFTAQYLGTPNTGNKSMTITKDGEGWNLVGNPYPSSIDWDADNAWTKTNVNNTTYIHVDNSTWATYVGKVGTEPGVGGNGGSQYIAPGQGFLVEASAAGSLGMVNDNVRVHHSTPFFKGSNELVNNMIRLQVSGNGYADEAVVRFLPVATPEFDGLYDGRKLFGDVAEAAQIYTLGSTPLAINSLPETNIVPLGIHAGASGEYTIAATEINDLKYVSLEDTKTGIYTELAVKPYTFTFTPGENEQRFNLHFSSLGIPETESQVAAVYSYHKTVYINMKDQQKGDIFIYNTSGQLVTFKAGATGMNEIGLTNTGIYMVKIVSDKTTFVKKVYVQ
jgi:hypothetical protein